MGFKFKDGIEKLAAIEQPFSNLLLREDIKKANVFLDFIPNLTFISDYYFIALKKLASVRTS